jgi:protein phosphatase
MVDVKALLDRVPWSAVARRLALIVAAAQGVKSARALTADVRRSLRAKRRRRAARARRDRDRDRDRDANRGDRASPTASPTASLTASPSASRSASRSAAAAPRPPSSATPGARPAPDFGVAARPGEAPPDDDRWLDGEHDELVPIEPEPEYAAAALDEVAMALAMEGKAGQSEKMANMALKVASARTPTSTSRGAGAGANASSRASSPYAYSSSTFGGASSWSGSPTPSDASRGGRGGASPDPAAFADAAFEMATRAAAMGDEAEGFTDDEEAEEVEAEAARRRAVAEAAAAAAAAAAEVEARRAAEAEAIREAAAAGARAAAARDAERRGGSFDEWVDQHSPREGEFHSAAPSPFESEDEDDDEDADVSGRGSPRPASDSPHVFDRAVRRSGPPPTPPSFRRASARPSDDDRAMPTSSSVVLDDAAPTLRLEVVSGGAWGSAVTAPPGTEALTIGRSDARDLVVNDAEVSSSHAEVRFTWLSDFLGESDGGANGGGVRRRRRDRAGFGSVSSDELDDASRGGAGEWRVADLGSTNGTFLNGVAIGGGGRRSSGPGQWRALRDGDEIRLGERSESPTIRVSVSPTTTTTASQTRATATGSGTGSPGFRGESALALRSGVRASPGRPPRMEDRALVESPLRGHPRVALFAVFDGHAGHEAASRAKAIFPAAVARRLGGRIPGPEGAADALRGAFLETDATMGCEYEGCAAAATLVWRCSETGRLRAQAANVGDCGVSLGRINTGRRNGVFLTSAHELTDREERERMESARGAPFPPKTTRVRGLGLTRTLGDGFLKREEPGLVAEPHVGQAVDVRGDGADVLVLASDGLWDVADAEEATEAAERAGRGARGGGGKRANENNDGGVTPSAAALALVELARKRRSRDDTVVVVVRMEA